MRKYYFGYQNWHGRANPIAWVEDNGTPVGGHYDNIGVRYEVTAREWESSNLTELSLKYPFVPVEGSTFSGST